LPKPTALPAAAMIRPILEEKPVFVLINYTNTYLLCFINAHLALFAIEMQPYRLTCPQTQVTRLFVRCERVRLTAVTQLKQQAVPTNHQRVARLHSFKTLIGIKYGFESTVTSRAI